MNGRAGTRAGLPALGALVILGACSPGAGAPPDESPEQGAGATAFPGTGGAPPMYTPPPVAAGGSPSIPAPPPTATGTATTPAITPPAATADYDQTVQFDWPEGAIEGGCRAGHYHGSFVGIYSPAIAVAPAPIPVTGDIDLVLAESTSGEFFEISGGKLGGVADLLFPFSADVKGRLDCATGKLVDGFLSNGVYIVGVIPYAFEGPLPASYDKQTHSFTGGTWDVAEPRWTTPKPLYGGSGTWTASYVGP